MSSRCHFGWCGLLLLISSGVASAEQAKRWSFKPDKGFVDEPMAFSGDDGRFAFFHTDAAQFLKLVVLRTDGYKVEKEFNLEDPSRVPRQLAFTPDGSRLVLVWVDGHSGAYSVSLYDAQSGKELKQLGPATAAAIADCGGEQCVTLTTARSGAAGTTMHTVTAFKTSDLKRVGTGSLTVQADQMLKKPLLRLLYFESGNLTFIGMQKGKYDKKRDLRLPERAVRWSLLTHKELWGEEPKDVLEWSKAVNMRPLHVGQNRFVHVSDDLKQLLFVDRDNKMIKLKLPVAWKLYEPKSLTQTESWDGKQLYFSLTIDPVNPDAVKRKKADKERVDLYRLDDNHTVVPLGQVDTGKRGFVWSVGGRSFAYLRRLKGFGRGGTEVELRSISPH